MSQGSKLPCLCSVCRQLKRKDLGRSFRKTGRLHDRRWICFHCLDKPKPEKMGRSTRPSALELKAREVLHLTGYRFEEQFQLKTYYYDICIPALRLLVELDSVTWHRHPSRQAIDKRKTKLAKSEGWDIRRVNTAKHELVRDQLKELILRREAELIPNLDY